MRRLGFILLSFIVLAAGCRKDDISGPESLRLRSITVEESSVSLPPGGSALIHFSVKDSGYPLVTDIGNPSFALVLRHPDGSVPDVCRISSVTKGKAEGEYVAVILDSGGGEAYNFRVRLSHVNGKGSGNESWLDSPGFTITCGSSGPDPGEELLVDTGLPVVVVNTASPVNSKTQYVSGTVKIQGAGGYEGLAEMSCQMRGRGNTTWTWPKKPYLLRLEEKQHIFGMHKHRRWVLLANFMDRTLMRNLVSMHVASMTSLEWSPGCVPVELVLNGKHVGSYLLIEQVRVDNHRVDITEMTPSDNSGDAVTGGYLLELDFHYDNEMQWKDHNIPFSVKYPDPDEITSQQKNYIKGYISEVSNVIYGSDFADPEKGYAKYLDVDSFIDYWIVYEVMGNHELGNPGSVFMHKDRGGLLVAGPCWDFDWGVLSYNTSPQARTGLVNGRAIWYARLFKDPVFKARVKERFEELLPQLSTVPDYMDECRKLLSKSAELNFKMWNPAEDASQNGGQIINGDENMSFDSAVDRLKSIYQDRLRVIPANL